MSQDLYPISVEGNWGYIDETGKVVIEPQFASASRFSEGLAVVSIAGESEEDRVFERYYEGFINTKGHFEIAPKPPAEIKAMEDYDSYSYDEFHEGLAKVHVNDATGVDGYIDRSGKLVISPQFGTAMHFSEGLAYVATGRWPYEGKRRKGFIDKSGKFVFENDLFKFAYEFKDGFCPVSIESEDTDYDTAMINLNGEFVIAPGQYSALEHPVEGAVRAVKNRQVGLIDLEGNVLVDFGAYKYITEPSDGSVFVAERENEPVTDLITPRGKIIATVKDVGDVKRFRSGFAVTKKNGKYGYIDERGKLAIPLKFDSAEDFHGDLAATSTGRERGYIDRQGNFVWKTGRWDTPIRNSVSKPLSDWLPDSKNAALPLSYNWERVKNAIVFVADGTLEEMRAGYRKRSQGNIEFNDFTDLDTEPGKINLMISPPDMGFIEVFAVDNNSESKEGFVGFYSCGNMNELFEKHPKKIIGIIIEN